MAKAKEVSLPTVQYSEAMCIFCQKPGGKVVILKNAVRHIELPVCIEHQYSLLKQWANEAEAEAVAAAADAANQAIETAKAKESANGSAPAITGSA